MANVNSEDNFVVSNSRCPICSLLLPGIQQCVSHLRQVHRNDTDFSLRCFITDDCTQTFSTFGGFNTHVYRKHRDCFGLAAAHLTGSAGIAAVENSSEPTLGIFRSHQLSFDPHDSLQYAVRTLLGTDEAFQREQAAEFLLKLREVCNVSNRAVVVIMDAFRNLLASSVATITSSIEESLANSGIDISTDLQEIMNHSPNPFDGLETIYLQDAFFKKNFPVPEPCEIPFATVHINRFSGTKRQKVASARSFLYVPLLQTLEELLKNDELRAEVEKNHQRHDLFLNDFCDGTFVKEHPLFSFCGNALQIIAYFDELEVTNPIGSYVNTHKLGCLFFTLGNIRPAYRSTFKAIFLVAVARTKDIDEYGIDTFLKPFVEDLKELYLNGLTVFEGQPGEKRYFGALTAFLADTAAAHKVGGFKGSVSFAKRICRSCMATKQTAQSFNNESFFELRTPDLHEVQCQSLCGSKQHQVENSVEFGINRLSVLEEVPGFSVSVNLPHDIMHDVFEGVFHYELKLFLIYCQSKGFFTINFLNTRIRGYDFGTDDRPSPFDPASLESPDKKFRQSASQTISLARHLPLLIADKVPENDDNWHSVLVLLKICQICLSPVHAKDTIPYLRVLIEEKLYLLKKLYPTSTIKPKMHYMVHYPSQIERYGPLIHSWTMRHEAKLSFVKRSSRRGNFKNIVSTVVKHHQRWLSYHLHCEGHLLREEPELSTVCEEIDRFTSEHIVHALKCVKPDITNHSPILRHKWLKLRSKVFKHGTFVLLKYDNFSPTFGKVIDILKVNHYIFFQVEVYVSSGFCGHYNSFVVTLSDICKFVDVHSLDDYHILLARRCYNLADNKLYITMPYMF